MAKKLQKQQKMLFINDEHKNIQGPIEKIIVKYQIPLVF